MAKSGKQESRKAAAAETRSQLPAPIYQSERATVYCADALAILSLLKGRVEAVVSDPPYGIGFSYGTSGNESIGFLKKHKVNANAVIQNDNVAFDPRPIIAAFISARRPDQVPVALMGADNYAHLLPVGAWYTWDKSCGMGSANSFTDSEMVWSNRRNPRRIFRLFWSGGMKGGEAHNTPRLHLSQKPVELMHWIIETIRVGIGKVILDPYMGSGSTGVAALRSGRRFIGIEIDPVIAAGAAARIAAAEADLPPGTAGSTLS